MSDTQHHNSFAAGKATRQAARNRDQARIREARQPAVVTDQPEVTPEDQFIAEQTAGGKTMFRGGTSLKTKFTGSKVTGADLGEAYMNARKAYAGQAPQEPVPQLPPRLRAMPNSPDLSSRRRFDAHGNQIGGSTMDAAARFTTLADQQNATNKRAGLAVKMTLANQVLNPEQTVDKAIAVKNAELAKSGITNLGGGTMAMANKYGTGYVEKLTPEQMATRKPGRIFEGGKEVDVATMMANKGKSTTMPYLNGGQSTAITLDAADANRAHITTATNRALTSPATAKRLAADRAAQVASYKTATAPLAASAKNRLANLNKPKQKAGKVAPSLPASRAVSPKAGILNLPLMAQSAGRLMGEKVASAMPAINKALQWKAAVPPTPTATPSPVKPPQPGTTAAVMRNAEDAWKGTLSWNSGISPEVRQQMGKYGEVPSRGLIPKLAQNVNAMGYGLMDFINNAVLHPAVEVVAGVGYPKSTQQDEYLRSLGYGK